MFAFQSQQLAACRYGNKPNTATLFVVATNAPAVALYEGLGYRELYRYHYRMVPTA